MKTNVMRLLLIAVVLIVGGRVLEAKSPYISKVYEYCPAPGQFVNVLPEFEAGDTEATMLAKANEAICGTEDGDMSQGMITLGGYGGYVVFGFDHLVVNVLGEYDFKVYGNASTGGAEPGIVMVSYDANDNGLPDDEWYEIAGSEYYKPETKKGYSIKYYKPDENKVKDPDPNYSFINDRTYIKWESSEDEQSYIKRNTFHSQPYYPQWITDETQVFTGTRLANNGIDVNGNGSFYRLEAFEWGYVDNQSNSQEQGIKIDWAVDAEGKSVALPGVNFVKVYTGVNQYCGWVGEVSSEVTGAEDLHPNVSGISNTEIVEPTVKLLGVTASELMLDSPSYTTAAIYNVAGLQVVSTTVPEGVSIIEVSNLSSGMYLLKIGNKTIKFIK